MAGDDLFCGAAAFDDLNLYSRVNTLLFGSSGNCASSELATPGGHCLRSQSRRRFDYSNHHHVFGHCSASNVDG